MTAPPQFRRRRRSAPPPPAPPTPAIPLAAVPTQVPDLPADEYARRLAAVRASMADRSLSALVVTDPANLYYLIGYNAWSFYVPQCLVVPAEGELRLFLRAMDAAGAGNTCYLPDEQVCGYPENLVHRPDAHPMEWIVDRAKDVGVLVDSPDATVAVEGDSHFFSARGYQAMVAGIPRARVVDSRELVNWVRVVKSPYEQDLMRIAGTIATTAMTKALAAVAIGRRQCDVAAEVAGAQASGTALHGGDYPSIVPMLPTGRTAGTPHLTWTDDPFCDGEATTIELAGVYRRYHVPLARTVSLGMPPARLSRIAEVVTEGVGAALQTARPGVTAGDVHAAFTAVINRNGYVKESRIGYSIGVGFPPDWGERTVSLRAGDTTILQAGMAFHMILGMWMDSWGYELSEPILITPDGAERLTDLPQELTIRR